jgi:hypothetical protein
VGVAARSGAIRSQAPVAASVTPRRIKLRANVDPARRRSTRMRPTPRNKEIPMKYLCLVYFDPQVFQGQSASERATLDRDSQSYDEELTRSGHYILAAALQPVSTATTIRKRAGKISMTDGPFAETREVLGGFIFIEARDLNEALKIAGDIPMARYGSIEVRPEFNF